jgi:hypothetical protein
MIEGRVYVIIAPGNIQYPCGVKAVATSWDDAHAWVEEAQAKHGGSFEIIPATLLGVDLCKNPPKWLDWT